MDRAMRLVFAGGLTLLLGGLALMGYLLYLRKNPPLVAGAGTGVVDTSKGPGFEPPVWSIPAFELIDQDGHPVDRSLLEGRVTVVWFMYSNCPIVCPTMTQQAAALQKRLKGSGVRFAGFSLDPANDRPAALKAFGDGFGVDWTNWSFLTEPESKLATSQSGRRIYGESLQRNVETNPASKIKVRGGTEAAVMDEINHGNEFFLIGPDGKVLPGAYYNSARSEQIETLRQRAVDSVEVFGRQGLLKP